MKNLMLLLAIGLAATEKLDRTYLPPPGSKFSGGEPGDLQAPPEFPKDSASTIAPFTPRPSIDGFAKTERPASKFPASSKDLVPVTPANIPFNFQNTYSLPTTTTSYAFTQTTTFPPTDGFVTTPTPIIPEISDKQIGFINQPFNLGQIFTQQSSGNYPGFIPPLSLPTSGSNVSVVPSLLPGSETTDGGVSYTPGQNIRQYQQSFPISTITPTLGSTQTGLPTSSPYDQGYTQHLGVQPPRQFIQQKPFPSSTATPGYQTNLPLQYTNNIQGTQVSKTFPPQQSTIHSFPQHSGDLNPVFGTAGATPQQGIQYPQLIRPQDGNLSPISGLQGTYVTGLLPGNQQVNLQPQFPGQQGTYQVPGPYGYGMQQQQGYVQQGPLNVPSNLPQGEIADQGYQYPRPQFVSQDNYQTSGIPQETLVPVSSVDQFSRDKQRQFEQQQNIYPNGITQGNFTRGTTSLLQPGGQQPQLISQQSLYPSTTPQGSVQGQIIPNQQNFQPKITEQGPFSSSFASQGNVLPGQVSYQQPQTFAQQSSFPTAILPGQISQEVGGQQPQITQQTFPSTGGKISPGFNGLPYQQQFSTPIPGTQQNFPLIGQPQLMEKGILSQQISTPKPGDQVGGLQSFYTPGPLDTTGRPTTSIPPYQQTSFSTTPSSIPSYGTTPNNIYPSYTAAYSGVNSANVPSRVERPQAESDRNAVILNYKNVLTPEGFAYNFDTSNGIHADENGTAINGVRANGSYSYIGDDGKLYSVVYSADENGFQPRGDHLPTPPPVPAAIQRVIEQAAKDKEAGVSHDGFYDEAKYGHQKYQGSKNRLPVSQNKIINGADIPGDTESRYEERDKMENGSQKKMRPVNFVKDKETSIDSYDTGYESDKDYNMYEQNSDKNVEKYPIRKVPTRRPITKKPGQFEYRGQTKNDLVINKQESTKPKHDGRASQNLDQDTPKRKPSRTGQVRKSEPSKDHYENAKDYDDEEFTNVREFDKSPYLEVYSKDTMIPIEITESGYSDDENDDEDLQSTYLPGRYSLKEQTANGKPQREKYPGLYEQTTKGTLPVKDRTKILATKYDSTDSSVKEEENYKEPGLPDEVNNSGPMFSNKKPNRIGQGSTFDDIKYPERSRYGQKNLPSYDYGTETTGGRKQQPIDEESGYLYTPPQSKFTEGKNEGFPSRFSDKAISRKSDTRFNTYEKTTTVKPFITPNVYHDKDESSEEDYKETAQKLPGKSTITSTTIDYENESYDDSSEQFDEQNEPEQHADEEKEISRKFHSGRPRTKGQRRPSYQNTSKPQYKDDEDTTENEETLSEHRPGQIDEGRYTSDTTESTASISSKKPYQPDSKRPSKQPGGRYQYPSTSKYTGDLSSEEEYTEDKARPDVSATMSGFSTKPVSKPVGFSDRTVISATDRPGFITIPSSRPTSQSSYEYSDKTMVPESAIDSDSRTPGQANYPSTLTYKTGGQSGQQNLPSTTYRPNYSITDIYQPGTGNIDITGRPLQPIQGNRRLGTQFGPTGTTRSGASVSAGQEILPTGQPGAYYDSGVSKPGKSGGQDETFKPTEPRFGSSVPASKPAEFGPSSVTTPGYLSPYGPTTGTFIGEDFSGPKQPQKFDPETGYYY